MATLLILVYTAFVMTFTLAIFNGLSFWWPIVFVVGFFIVGSIPVKKKEKADAE